MIHSGCYDSWILIFFPDFTAVSLDKALKDRANRVLVSNMASLVGKLGALVLLRWWWCCSLFLSSGYSYFREQNVEQQWFVWFLQANLLPFLWEKGNMVLLSKPWKVMPKDELSILISWENRIVKAPCYVLAVLHVCFLSLMTWLLLSSCTVGTSSITSKSLLKIRNI